MVPAIGVSVVVHVMLFSALSGIRPLEVGSSSVLAMSIKHLVEREPPQKTTPIDVPPPKRLPRPKLTKADPQPIAIEAAREEPAAENPKSGGDPAPTPALGTIEPENGTGPRVPTGSMTGEAKGPGPQELPEAGPHRKPDGHGTGGTGGGHTAGDLRGYHRGIYAAVNAGRRYPSEARRLGLEGRAVLAVRIDRRGHIVDKPRIAESSKHAILDEEAMRMVVAAAPFPPLPDSYDKPDAEFMIPIRFKLSD
jgi:protein TonB